jgi:hypothetical protein
LAEQLEPVKKREEEYKAVIIDREKAIQQEKIEKEKLMEEIKELNKTLTHESKQNNILTDMKLEWESVVDKKDTQIH